MPRGYRFSCMPGALESREDYAEAVEWLRKAAEHGEADGLTQNGSWLRCI
jgi:TPR repeat protein